MTAEREMCACGEPLHFPNEVTYDAVMDVVRRMGADIKVSYRGQTWLIPRTFIALHGLSAWRIPELAEQYHWPEVVA